MVLGFIQKVTEREEEAPQSVVNEKDDRKSPETEKAVYEPLQDVYKTVKKEPGSYSVIGPDKSEAIVIKVETHDEGKYWIAILATKEGKKSERVKTKKEAVALAIELLKEHKGN